jgi:hypothetical protein
LTCGEINNMTSIALGRGDVVVGVDTHKDEHVAVALDGLGGRLGELAIVANPDGYAELVAWAISSERSPRSVSRAPAPTAAAWRGSSAGTPAR